MNVIKYLRKYIAGLFEAPIRIRLADYGTRLHNRNSSQGDGSGAANFFRAYYLGALHSPAWWRGKQKVVIDCEGVKSIGPAWANEAFAFFTAIGISPECIIERVEFENISIVKRVIIENEIKAEYYR